MEEETTQAARWFFVSFIMFTCVLVSQLIIGLIVNMFGEVSRFSSAKLLTCMEGLHAVNSTSEERSSLTDKALSLNWTLFALNEATDQQYKECKGNPDALTNFFSTLQAVQESYTNKEILASPEFKLQKETKSDGEIEVQSNSKDVSNSDSVNLLHNQKVEKLSLVIGVLIVLVLICILAVMPILGVDYYFDLIHNDKRALQCQSQSYTQLTTEWLVADQKASVNRVSNLLATGTATVSFSGAQIEGSFPGLLM